MIFYICTDTAGHDFDCFTSLAEAKKLVGSTGGGEVVAVDVPVTAETIRKLLGGYGGYATKSRIIKVKDWS
jgi:hypothetical protein